MQVWISSRFFALFLGFWVALAPAVFALPAAAITVQTGMSDDAGPGGDDCCPEEDMERGLCALMCLNTAQFATMEDLGKLAGRFGSGHELGHHPALFGRLLTPDPAPPNPVSLL
jgi:hypothetical protein